MCNQLARGWDGKFFVFLFFFSKRKIYEMIPGLEVWCWRRDKRESIVKVMMFVENAKYIWHYIGSIQPSV